MKRLLTVTAALSLAFAPVIALASDALPTPTPKPKSIATSKQGEYLTRLQTKGAAEIDRRLTSLTAALQRVQDSTTLTDAHKQTLVAQIQAEIDALTALKTKLAADTKLSTARTDVQSIFTEYRVYGLLLPKAQMVTAADRLAEVGKKFEQLAERLQKAIDTAKAAGHDVADIQADLDEMKSKMDSARAKYADLAATVIALAPSDYNADHTALRGYRDGLKEARADFKAAHDAAKSAMDALKAFR